jgi:penicillin amidase
LGPIVDPAHGVWALAASAEHPATATATLAGLDSSVDVRYDDRGVPHIFAKSELDATRALGYVVARDRLFQLELQTRAAAGTLTELVGPAALEADRTARRLGLSWGAERKYAALDTHSMGFRAMRAYAEGVNSYIRQMPRSRLPLEYRLLNRRPQQWKPEHSMYLLVRMGYTLAYSDFELQRPSIESRIGVAATDALFPRHAYVQEPIQPNGQRAARVDAPNFPAPKPDSTLRALAHALASFAPVAGREPGSGIGSNNWAVSPRRSASGFALLANDPHLDLSLPSIWYEVHVVVRDSLDAYGVTFPGGPGIALGLNRDIAWGSTNTGADVADYYIEIVDDSLHPTRYQLDGAWRKVESSTEYYRDQAGHTIAVDTLFYTHRGPLFRVGSSWLSRRWLVLEPSAEFESFRQASHARSVREFFAAMDGYVAPAQNFVVADRGGHIGIRSTGRYPVRPANRGDRFFDGSASASDWRGWFMPDSAPQSVDPAQGFLASANQEPADPRAFSLYLGNDWPTPWRAMRINTLLRNDSTVTPDAMRRFQTDPGNARADFFVPLFLSAAAHALAADPDSTLARAARLLGDWNRLFTPDNERAVLFEAAMRELARYTWDELAVQWRDSVPERLIATPWEHVLVALTKEPESVWWDRVNTPQRETRDDIFALSLRAALTQLEEERGRVEEGNWRWSRIRTANIWHPLRIRALSALDLSVQGGRESLSPSFGSGTHGASWRLVAELGPEIRARGIFPGGESANPFSSHYRDHVESWRIGQLDSLRIPSSPDSLGATGTAARLTLIPAQR